jgi:hypothetical protein
MNATLCQYVATWCPNLVHRHLCSRTAGTVHTAVLMEGTRTCCCLIPGPHRQTCNIPEAPGQSQPGSLLALVKVQLEQIASKGLDHDLHAWVST